METPKTLRQELLECQQEIETIDKDGNNPYFKSKYATLGATISACKEILNAHNILCLQPIESDESGVYVCTTLLHTQSSEAIVTKMKIMSKSENDPQAQGSAITYARRYSLQSLLFMTADDDDGEKATNHASPNATTATKQVVDDSEYDATENALCRVHQNPDGSSVVMKHYQNDKGEWWSHQTASGTWCNGRATVGNKNL